jgi:hypothetical protein
VAAEANDRRQASMHQPSSPESVGGPAMTASRLYFLGCRSHPDRESVGLGRVFCLESASCEWMRQDFRLAVKGKARIWRRWK